MPKALSQDLRLRIVNAYQNNEGSIRNLAKRFTVSISSVTRLLRLSKIDSKLDFIIDYET